MLTNARQNRQVSACLQTNCCRLVYTLIAVGRVSADPLRTLTVSQNSALLKTPNQRSKVRCWQSNPLSKVHESKIGYTVKLQYEGRRKRCRRKDPLRKLDCLPKIWLYYKIQIQGRKCVVGKVYPLSKLHETKIGYSESSNMKVVGNGVGWEILGENLTVSQNLALLISPNPRLNVRRRQGLFTRTIHGFESGCSQRLQLAAMKTMSDCI